MDVSPHLKIRTPLGEITPRAMPKARADYLDRLRAGEIEPGIHEAPLGHHPTSMRMPNADSGLVVSRQNSVSSYRDPETRSVGNPATAWGQ